MGMEAIRNAIHVVLPSLQSTCDTVHCLGERALLSSSFVAVFWRFLPSNTPIMLYNIWYWWFLLSQGNWWTKYLVHPKIRRPRPCLLMFGLLVTLNNFHPLLFTQLTANLTSEWSGGSMFYPLSYNYAKTSFCYVETVANNALNHGRVIVFDQTRYPLWTQLSYWQMIMQNGEYTAFWYLQLLCFLTQLQFMIGQNEFVEFLWCFPGQLPNLCDLSVQALFAARSHLKSAYHLLTVVSNGAESEWHLSSHCFAWTVFFPVRKQYFINTKFRFFHYFENLQQ